MRKTSIPTILMPPEESSEKRKQAFTIEGAMASLWRKRNRKKNKEDISSKHVCSLALFYFGVLEVQGSLLNCLTEKHKKDQNKNP